MDALRDQRGLPWLEDLAQDARFAIRSLRKQPVIHGGRDRDARRWASAPTRPRSASCTACSCSRCPTRTRPGWCAIWENVPGPEIGDGRGPARRYDAMDVVGRARRIEPVTHDLAIRQLSHRANDRRRGWRGDAPAGLRRLRRLLRHARCAGAAGPDVCGPGSAHRLRARAGPRLRRLAGGSAATTRCSAESSRSTRILSARPQVRWRVASPRRAQRRIHRYRRDAAGLPVSRRWPRSSGFRVP